MLSSRGNQGGRNLQGRFTSVDPLGRSASVGNPQSFNRYSYVLNNPTNLTDPSGMMTGADASQSWGDVSGTFWGNAFDFNASHFGGPDALAGAAAMHDRWVDIDGAGGEYGDDDYPDSTGNATATAEANSPTGDQQNPSDTITGTVSEAPQQAIVVNGTPDQDALINAGQAEAVSRVQQITPCGAFFGGADKATRALTGTAWNIQSSMHPSGHPQAMIGPGTYVYVNPAGGLLQPNGSTRSFGLVDPVSKAGFTISLVGAQARAFAMLHETAHKRGKFGKTDNDDPRTKSGPMNGRINNFKIWKACFPGVTAKPWTGGGLPPP